MKKYFPLCLALVILAALPYAAFAQANDIWIYCGGLPGCPSGFTEYFSSVLTLLLVRLPNYVYILGVLFIMIGGIYMVISVGDTEKVTKGKNTIIWSVIGIFVMQFAETVIRRVVIAEVNTRNQVSGDLIESLTGTIIDDIFLLIYGVLIIVAVISGMRMVLSFGKDEEFTKGKEGLFWAAVGAIIINLANAIATAFLLPIP